MTRPDPELLAQLTGFDVDEPVVRWAERALRTAFRKNRTEVLADDDRVRHVLDWIAGGIAGGSPWTRSLDAEGFPVRLTRFGSLDHAWRTADKMIRREAEIQRQALVAAGEEVSGGVTEMLLDDGWRMVRLTTPRHLDFETAFMDHCIGGGAYDDKVVTGRSLFYSLRDGANRPHVTIEAVDEGPLRVVQCRGPGNAFPTPDVLPFLLRFLTSMEADYAFLAPMFGRIADTHGTLHDLGSIGPGFAAKGPVWFVPGVDVDLPEKLRVAGDVHVASRARVRFGSGTTVFGTLHAEEGSLEEIPDGMTVSQDLHAPSSGLRRIGSGVRIMGTADLRRCPVESIGDDLVVGKNLSLSRCLLPVLPKMWVSDTAVLGDGIESIGDGFFCRTLEASDGDIVSIGDDVTVVRRASLPRTLRTIGRNFRTDAGLDFNCPDLSEIGDGFTVGGSLCVYESSLRTLPDGCSVGRGFEAPRSAIETLPADMRIGHAIDAEDFASERRPTFDMKGSRLASLPDGFTYGGDVDIGHCPIRKLPAGMRVAGDLYAKDSALKNLPADLEVGLDLVLNGSPVESLPDGMSVLWLGLEDAPIRELPSGLVLKDGGDLARTAITALPADMVAGGELILPAEMEIPPGVTATVKVRLAGGMPGP